MEELREFLRRTYGDDAASRMIVENSVDPETGRQFLALLTEGWGETQSTWAQNWFLGAEHVGALGEHYRTSFSEHDMMLRHKFMSLWQAVKEGECDEWELEGAALVAALALVLDQVRASVMFPPPPASFTVFISLPSVFCYSLPSTPFFLRCLVAIADCGGDFVWVLRCL